MQNLLWSHICCSVIFHLMYALQSNKAAKSLTLSLPFSIPLLSPLCFHSIFPLLLFIDANIEILSLSFSTRKSAEEILFSPLSLSLRRPCRYFPLSFFSAPSSLAPIRRWRTDSRCETKKKKTWKHRCGFCAFFAPQVGETLSRDKQVGSSLNFHEGDRRTVKRGMNDGQIRELWFHRYSTVLMFFFVNVSRE